MNRIIFHIVNAVLAVAFCVFYCTGFNGIMHGIEGNSLFLFTGQYASEMLSRNGGVANYLGAFLTQFYYYPLLGSALVGLLLSLLTLGVSRFCKSDICLPLALLPSMACAILLLDPKWTLAMPAALCLGVWIAYGLSRIRPLSLALPISAAAAAPVWIKVVNCQFYTYAVAPRAVYFAIVGATVMICVAGSLMPEKRSKWMPSLLSGLLIASVAFVAHSRVDELGEEVAEYSYMVRVRDWDGILGCASGSKLKSPLSTNAVNLALLMKGRLGDDMFNYYQSGPRSLVNFEERKISSEILYLLGFVNEARHLAFEDMAGNPSRDRGVYHLTRLVNFNAVDSLRRPVADRYLNTLHHTLFYRDFEPERLVSPEMEPCEDFFFDFGDFSRMLGFLYHQKTDNVRARDYFAASLLLGKQTSLFCSFFSRTEVCPKSWDEAFQINESMNGGATTPQLQAYVDMYNACRGKAGGMGCYAGTYWYYFNFR